MDRVIAAGDLRGDTARGYAKLAGAVIERAFDDLSSKDAVIRAKARLWLFEDGRDLLDLLNCEYDPFQFEYRVIFGGG